jgi:predicted histone-like DNA-binding protein
MKYKLISRENPLDRTEVKYYASPVNDGKISKDDLSKEIVDMSALSRGDVSSVIENFIDVIPKYLLMGKSVSLGELGTMRISFGSESVVDPKHFNTSKISSPKIIFTPSPVLRGRLRDIHYELETRKPATTAAPRKRRAGRRMKIDPRHPNM